MENILSATTAYDDQPSRQLAWITALMLTGVFLISILYHPSGGNYFTICGFKNATGLPCPGCGLTHSFCAIGKGHFLAAFEWNLFGPPLFLLFAVLWVRALFVLSNRLRFPLAFDAFAERYRIVRWLSIGFAVFGVARILYILIADPSSVQDTPLSDMLSHWLS